jgi:predicted ATPase
MLPHRPSADLPTEPTSLVGRGRERAELSRLLETARLLTLTGAGGVGKTRLALELARDVADGYEQVRFVELAPLADASLVPPAIATALGVREESGRPLPDTLTEVLQARRLLLILDNCEHLVDACARLADVLLRACPQLTILATSREALNVPAELAWPVPPLALPPAGRPLPVDELLEYEAVRLFVERAVAVTPAFRLSEQNAAAVARVCHRLDGIPLALELAAARLRVLTVAEIAERLDERFRLLTRGSRTAPARHQTLRALVDWSYDLLSPAERRLFRRLSVFAGGWSLEAAEAVAGGDVGESHPDLRTQRRDHEAAVRLRPLAVGLQCRPSLEVLVHDLAIAGAHRVERHGPA